MAAQAAGVEFLHFFVAGKKKKGCPVCVEYALRKQVKSYGVISRKIRVSSQRRSLGPPLSSRFLTTRRPKVDRLSRTVQYSIVLCPRNKQDGSREGGLRDRGHLAIAGAGGRLKTLKQDVNSCNDLISAVFCVKNNAFQCLNGYSSHILRNH